MNARSLSHLTTATVLALLALTTGVQADFLPGKRSFSETGAARVALRGSERDLLSGAHGVTAADPAESLTVTVRLRTQASLRGHLNAISPRLPSKRRYLSRKELGLAFGADAGELRRVEAFAREHGLAVVSSDVERRRVELTGTVAAFDAAFGVALQRYEYPGGAYRGHMGAISLPVELAGIVESVAGLDDRPQAEPRLRSRDLQPRALGDRAFTAPEVAQLYDFPKGVDGTGQCIGIIELGGGFRDVDLDNYFAGLKLPRPQVVAVSVDGAQNRPGRASSADGEVMLDIEIAGAVAPGARIAVYFAPNSERSFLNAVDAAIHDQENQPSVIAICWGKAETGWSRTSMESMDRLFQEAAALGVTICIASGDWGATDGVRDGKNHVDFPASSPFALACGGTRFQLTGGDVSGEAAWDDGVRGGATGGGVSDVFAQPDWQLGANVPTPGRRGVPDVAGNASPNTGYRVLVNGQQLVVGGTSAVAPLWAGLTALMNQSLGERVGYLNPVIAALSAETGAFNDILAGGGDTAFPATAGWDAATGLGSPAGVRLLEALRGNGG
jgi:kumamolisin